MAEFKSATFSFPACFDDSSNHQPISSDPHRPRKNHKTIKWVTIFGALLAFKTGRKAQSNIIPNKPAIRTVPEATPDAI